MRALIIKYDWFEALAETSSIINNEKLKLLWVVTFASHTFVYARTMCPCFLCTFGQCISPYICHGGVLTLFDAAILKKKIL